MSGTVHCGRCGKAMYRLLVDRYECELFESLGIPCLHYDAAAKTTEMDASMPCAGCRIIHEVINRDGDCACTSEETGRFMAHLLHGEGNWSEGPSAPDCACRGTHREADCAAEGCGFCRSAGT